MSGIAQGDTLVLLMNETTSTLINPTAASVVDSAGNRWIKSAYSSTVYGGLTESITSEIWYARGVAAGTTAASIFFSQITNFSGNFSEWSGVWNISPLDQWSSNFGTSGSVQTIPVTPRQNGDLILATGVALNNPPPGGPTSGYTSLAMSSLFGTQSVGAYLISGASVATSTSWGVAPGNWQSVAVALVAANGLYSPGQIPQNPNLQFPETLVEVCTQPNFQAPLNGQGIWTNISSYIQQMSLGPIGRQHELDRIQATAAQLTVNNRDGTFNPWNTSSFLYNSGAGLKPMNPVRVTAAWNGVTYPIYYGYLQSDDPIIADVLNVTATISCVDILQMLSLKYLTNDPYAQLIASDGGSNLVAYYRTGDMIGSYSVKDSSGNANTGSLIAGPGGDPAFGIAGPFLYDANTGLDLTNGTNTYNGGFSTIDNSTEPPTVHNPLANASVWSMESWFKWTSTTTPAPSVAPQGTASSVAPIPNGILYHFTAMGASVSEIQLGSVTYTSNNKVGVAQPNNFFGVIWVDANAHDTFAQSTANNNPLDGNWHHLVIVDQNSGVTASLITAYLDGAQMNPVASNTAFSSASISSISVGTSPQGVTGLDPSLGTNFAQGFPGYMDEVAFYSTILTPAQILNHYTTGKWFSAVEFGASVGAAAAGRFNKVLKIVGLDPSVILNVPYPFNTALYAETNSLTTTSALNYMQTQSQSEPGVIFQGPNGIINAYSREYQYLAPSAVTSQGVFADNTGASVTGYYDGPSLQIVQDDTDIWNDIQVQSGKSGALNVSAGLAVIFGLASSGAQLQEWSGVQSPALASSASVYGSRTLQGLTSLQMNDDPTALAIAQNYGVWYGLPLRRVVQLALNSQGGGGINIPQMLARGIYDRITVGYNGQTPSTPFQQDALIESISHVVDLSQPTWTTTWATSPYEILMTPFIFGNNAQSQLGGAASVTGSGTSWIHHPPAGQTYLSGNVIWTVASGATIGTAWNATAATVQTALASLVPSTTVTGGPTQSGNLVIAFGSSQATFSAVFQPAISLTL
jgi:hypothetical protein